jgi:hypothetical protein
MFMLLSEYSRPAKNKSAIIIAKYPMLNGMTTLTFVYTNAAINTALPMTTTGDIFTSAIIRLTATFIQNSASAVNNVAMERAVVEHMLLFIKTSGMAL